MPYMLVRCKKYRGSVAGAAHQIFTLQISELFVQYCIIILKKIKVFIISWQPTTVVIISFDIYLFYVTTNLIL